MVDNKTFTIELDRSMLDLALRCGVDLSYDGPIAIKQFILSRMIGVSFETVEDAAQVASMLLGEDWTRWIKVVERESYGEKWCELRLVGAAWEYLTEHYMTPSARAQFMRDLSTHFDRQEEDHE